MTFKETMALLFSTSQGTYYKWKKENRPIINLISKYFTIQDLEEFVTTGIIPKYEDITNINYINKLINISLDNKKINISYLDYCILIEYLHTHLNRLNLYNEVDIMILPNTNEDLIHNKFKDLKDDLFKLLDEDTGAGNLYDNYSNKRKEYKNNNICNGLIKVVNITNYTSLYSSDILQTTKEYNISEIVSTINLHKEYLANSPSSFDIQSYNDIILFLNNMDFIELYYFLLQVHKEYQITFKHIEIFETLGKNDSIDLFPKSMQIDNF